jgi:3-(3-hydroxy-phenyl)propionate hydroxylase
MRKFRHGRVLFAGDAAHAVSPFGARGANSGVQDADNLAWKLALVLGGQAPDSLLDTYASEREYAADENILNSTRSTDFITPKNEVSRAFRNAVLTLAKDCAFARRMVNSGRLSVATTLRDTPLNTPDADMFAGGLPPGSAATDAPLMAGNSKAWFLHLLGGQFTTVYFAGANGMPKDWGGKTAALIVLPKGAARTEADGATVVEDNEGLLAQRLDAQPGTTYLFRPDQHVCARWRRFDPESVGAALSRAMGQA